MSKTVVGVFRDNNFAEKAAAQIRDQGLRTEDISIVAREGDGELDGPNATMKSGDRGGNDNISDGVVSGGVLGGIAGLVLGAGSLMIPGLGIIAAAGPITGLLSGAVTGGIVGGLVDLGIPENKSRQYENDIREGRVLFSMRTDDDKVSRVGNILRSNGAISVDTY